MKKQILLMFQNLKMRPRFPGYGVPILLFLTSTVFAQVNVKGKVTDETSKGMPGVNILLKGTATGTVSDSDGNYSISVPDGNQQTLVFSFIGYTTQEIGVNGRTTIDIAMAIDAQQLGEIVVVGYGTQKKSDVTGAMAQLSD